MEVNGTKAIQLRSSCSEFASHSCVYLHSESESELDEWFSTINKRLCGGEGEGEEEREREGGREGWREEERVGLAQINCKVLYF